MKFYYLAIVIIIVIVGLAGYLFFREKSAAGPGAVEPVVNTMQPATLIPFDPATIPPGEKISLGTAHGTVMVKNFYKVAQGYDGEALVIHQTEQYQILYSTEASVFVIYIIGGPVYAARKAAEDDLVNTLGISRTEICYLNVSWSVSAAVDSGLFGGNYPLSFCKSEVQ